MRLIFEQIRVGGDRNFGYLLGDREKKVGVLIDPSYAPEMLVERATAQGLTITHIVNTHGHDDHINGNVEAQRLTKAPIAAHPDSPAMPEIRLTDGDELELGALRLKFLYVPGHCEDHIVVYEAVHEVLITGDLLFVGKVGGTGSEEDALAEWSSLQRVLKLIPHGATVWPGHDYGARPSSTLQLELASNPFLQCADVAEFLALKKGWGEFKKRNGLK